MNRRNLIAGIIVSTLVIVGIITGITIFALNIAKDKTDETFWEFIEVIEGKEEYGYHTWGINLNGIADKGDTLTFNFNTNPSGLMEVYLEKYSEFKFDLLTAESVDNYKIVLPENGCTLYFMNLEAFTIILTLNFTVKK